ncbi:putative glycosyltransferase [Rivularia sp. PCC 7116]|uniref:glycosyltransferase family 2 protein n=1 Tax=Rivularia sp. PCC 7116 TaxID=373994 RepID=UPI00029F10A6|nr:glycosyltransferase family 2 protein [Rivularia sp. PCC 7116]AFY56663.1 putative glycosyltransferase [Rivularia sp. PCC 7116]
MSIAVIIPTYRRSQDLARCLKALQNQTRLADEVIVVVRDTDTETWSFLKAFDCKNLALRTTTVTITGVVAAMNVGLDAADSDIVAFTDDDAAAHPDWLARLESHYLADELVGGVGGRDWVYHGTDLEDGNSGKVGQVSWFGRVIGNHHIGAGEAREVDVLKGVNMSFRRAAIQGWHFDERMKGTGAQVHFELAFSLKLKRAGWKLIYDPQVAVNHYPAKRFDEDRRNSFNQTAFANAVHNETVALLEYFSPFQKLAFLFWAVAVGTREAMGFIQWLRFLPSEGLLAGKKLLASWYGRWQGVQTVISEQ